jgi:hypothetical protein
VEADHARLICAEDTAVALNPVGTLGAVVSAEPLLTVTVTVALVVELFEVSVAIARSVCVPFADFVVSHEKVYGVAVSAAPTFALSN